MLLSIDLKFYRAAIICFKVMYFFLNLSKNFFLQYVCFMFILYAQRFIEIIFINYDFFSLTLRFLIFKDVIYTSVFLYIYYLI